MVRLFNIPFQSKASQALHEGRLCDRSNAYVYLKSQCKKQVLPKVASVAPALKQSQYLGGSCRRSAPSLQTALAAEWGSPTDLETYKKKRIYRI